MQLQGRELRMMTTGDDVKLLQQELRRLGYSIRDTEAQQGSFGQSTQAAVMDFQKKHGLQPSGIVDTSTATVDQSRCGRAESGLRRAWNDSSSRCQAGDGRVRKAVIDS